MYGTRAKFNIFYLILAMKVIILNKIRMIFLAAIKNFDKK